MFFRLATSAGEWINSESTMSEVYYEVHMTRFLYTARISNVDSAMFVDRNERDGKFWARFFSQKFL